MKAVVFAAGIGSRLKPFTDSHPKALAPVAGVPALGRVLGKLAQAGVDGVVVNVHHFADQVEAYLRANDFGLEVEISDERPLLLDTAGALAKMARQSRMLKGVGPDEPVVVHNADIITDFDLGQMVAEHVLGCADATVLVNPQRRSSRAFLFEPDGRLAGWRNSSSGEVKPAGLDTEGLAAAPFGGVHVLRRSLLDRISEALPAELKPSGIVDFYLRNLDRYNFRGHIPPDGYYWFDIGTPEKLAEADRALLHL